MAAQAEQAVAIVCGHIHRQDIKTKPKSGIHYINCGDGLTHGGAVAHIAGGSDDFLGQWVGLKGKTMKGDWDLATAPVDPDIRHKTMEFLQLGWEACLMRLKHETELSALTERLTARAALVA